MDMDTRIFTIFKNNYDIKARSIKQCPGGWSALAYSVEDESQTYFLKVYNKDKPSVAPGITDIEKYNPLVKWLHDHTDLKNHIIHPIKTKSSSYRCEDERFVYLLSEFIEGTTIGEKQLNPTQVNELAKILGRLHTTLQRYRAI